MDCLALGNKVIFEAYIILMIIFYLIIMINTAWLVVGRDSRSDNDKDAPQWVAINQNLGGIIVGGFFSILLY